jgi:hypothetical protein
MFIEENPKTLQVSHYSNMFYIFFFSFLYTSIFHRPCMFVYAFYTDTKCFSCTQKQPTLHLHDTKNHTYNNYFSWENNLGILILLDTTLAHYCWEIPLFTIMYCYCCLHHSRFVMNEKCFQQFYNNIKNIMLFKRALFLVHMFCKDMMWPKRNLKVKIVNNFLS